MKTKVPFHHTKSAQKAKYRVQNWHDYEQGLVARGSLTVWIPDDIEERWYAQGRQTYTNTAIELVLVLKLRFSLPLRGAEGFARSIFDLVGRPLIVPDHSTLSRRAVSLSPTLKKRLNKQEVDFILDSTGAKVLGEGEWKVRTHGKGKRRTWTKIHIGIDSDGEIRAVVTTLSNTHDSTPVNDLLLQETRPIQGFWGDGAYDAAPVYMALAAHRVKDVHIPPHKNARIRKHGNAKGPPLVRDEHIRSIREKGRKRWKQESGYHTRSLAETNMFRYKTTFGDRMSFRNRKSQATEAVIKCTILNRFYTLGMPESVKAA